jgi:predicted nucleic acid-binding protein
MTAVLVDSNVILDLFEDDKRLADWSESTLNQYADSSALVINSVIYAEVSIGFARIEELEKALSPTGGKVVKRGHLCQIFLSVRTPR